MNTPNMTKEQLKELAQIERHLKAMGREKAACSRQAKKAATAARNTLDIKLAKAELLTAQRNLQKLVNAAAKAVKEIGKTETAQLKSADKVTAKLEQRRDILRGRLSS